MIVVVKNQSVNIETVKKKGGGNGRGREIEIFTNDNK